MVKSSRITRGRATQKMIARYWQRWWPDAEAVEGAVTGADVRGMHAVSRATRHPRGLAPEVKAVSDHPGSGKAITPVLAALRQAERHAADGQRLPLVVWRPNGFGEESIEDWVMCFTVERGTKLLLDAGYGIPDTVPIVTFTETLFDDDTR